MAAFLLCLILTFIIALGGREQLIVAQFSESLERSPALLATAVAGAVASACIMAFAGAAMAELLPRRAAEMLVAFALAIAAFELAWPVKLRVMREPTRSLVAIGVVVLARQVGDGARFAVFAFAAWAVFPTTAAIGGALGGAAAATLGWSIGLTRLQAFPLRYLRLALAVCMILAALLIGLNARYTFL